MTEVPEKKDIEKLKDRAFRELLEFIEPRLFIRRLSRLLRDGGILLTVLWLLFKVAGWSQAHGDDVYWDLLIRGSHGPTVALFGVGVFLGSSIAIATASKSYLSRSATLTAALLIVEIGFFLFGPATLSGIGILMFITFFSSFAGYRCGLALRRSWLARAKQSGVK